jgi:hypothetical protein
MRHTDTYTDTQTRARALSLSCSLSLLARTGASESAPGGHPPTTPPSAPAPPPPPTGVGKGTVESATKSILSGRVDNPLVLGALALVGLVVMVGAVNMARKSCRRRKSERDAGQTTTSTTSSSSRGLLPTHHAPTLTTSVVNRDRSGGTVDYLRDTEARASAHAIPVYDCGSSSPPPAYTAGVISPRANKSGAVTGAGAAEHPHFRRRVTATGADYREMTMPPTTSSQASSTPTKATSTLV